MLSDLMDYPSDGVASMSGTREKVPRPNPDSGSMVMLLLLGVGAAGAYVFLKNRTPAPPIVPPSGGPPSGGSTQGVTIPSNLLDLMQHAFWLAGSDPNNFGSWIQSMQQNVLPLSAGAWTYVYHQWAPVYDQSGHAWPSNAQLTLWVQQGIANYG